MSPPIEPPPRWLLPLEGRALLEGAALPYALPALNRGPRGDGHSVLVLPGFLAGSTSTAPLRWFLKSRGYTPHCWRLGRNLGFDRALGEAMDERLRELSERSGRRVSLIGWSLGGVYAREIARDLPQCVRQVVTLGSPFRGAGRGSRVSTLYAAINGRAPSDIDPEMLGRMEAPPPVPCTAVYSRSDGVVSWQATVERVERAGIENVEVRGAHCGLGVNAAVWSVIADRLAQGEDSWRPFAPRGLQRFLYPHLESVAFRGDPRQRRFRRDRGS